MKTTQLNKNQGTFQRCVNCLFTCMFWTALSEIHSWQDPPGPVDRDNHGTVRVVFIVWSVCFRWAWNGPIVPHFSTFRLQIYSLASTAWRSTPANVYSIFPTSQRLERPGFCWTNGSTVGQWKYRFRHFERGFLMVQVQVAKSTWGEGAGVFHSFRIPSNVTYDYRSEN